MLAKPSYGWVQFQLEGTAKHSLGNLGDIAYEWIDQAIHGLETMYPFCVEAFMEPDRFLCTVSYWNCHIIIEDDERDLLTKEEIFSEYSHTSMIEFCKFLYQDVSECFEEWVLFAEWTDDEERDKRKELHLKLERLKELIAEKESSWGNNRFFS